MKTSFKCLLLLLVSLFFIIETRGQELADYNGDTVVIISPNDLKTINCIITDYEFQKKKIDFQESIIKLDSVLIQNKDSIIKQKDIVYLKKEELYIENISQLEKTIKKEKRKKTIFTTILGALAISLGTLIVVK